MKKEKTELSRAEKLKRKNSLQRKPVHQRTREEREPFFRGKVSLLVIVGLVASLAYLVFFSGVFEIKEIRVEGYSNPEVVEGIVVEVSQESLAKNNLLFINKGSIEAILLGDPKIKGISVRKILPSGLSILVEESAPELIWNSAGDRLLVDGGGYVSGKVKNETLVEVYDGSNISVDLGERVASPTFINYIKELSERFELVTGAKIERITIFDTMSDVHVLSSSGWTVYLDTTKSIESQLDNLNRVLAEAGNGGSGLEYIDMRLDSRIYYK